MLVNTMAVTVNWCPGDALVSIPGPALLMIFSLFPMVPLLGCASHADTGVYIASAD